VQFYLLKRLFMTVLVLFLLTVLLSLLVHVVPGDPARTLLGARATEETVARVQAEMDLDKPVPVQVANFITDLLHGDFGNDVFTGRPISEAILSVLPHTIILAGSSIAVAVLTGIPLGIFSATHPGSWLDRLTAIISISFIIIPTYVIGLILLRLFGVELGWLPVIGLGDEGDPVDYLLHLILPTVTLAITWIGYLARLVRASLLEVLNETYIRAAMAAGIRERLILYKYALKNALIPTVAVLGLGIGNLMGGALFTELIFARPGMGRLVYRAVETRNFPTMRAGVLVVAFFFVIANLMTDLVYTYLDPRIEFDSLRGR
jgi:peptide/nickel transport system permease protein